MAQTVSKEVDCFGNPCSADRLQPAKLETTCGSDGVSLQPYYHFFATGFSRSIPK